jgi:hypothetical protein
MLPSCPTTIYHFDPVRKTLSGERSVSELSFRLGDSVRVLVLRASVEGQAHRFPHRATEAGAGRIAQGGARRGHGVHQAGARDGGRA